ncbi:MAG: glycosyltransferase family 4 protein [Chloroflexia bacterium]
MNILVLAPQWPDPPRQGAAIRNLHILLYLARRHKVTLLTFAPDGPVEKSRLAEACEHVEILPPPIRTTAQRLKTLALSPLPDMAWRLHSDLMRERIRILTETTAFDAIHTEGIEMAPYALFARGILSKRRIKASITYDAHNAEYLLQRRAFTTDFPHLQRLPKALYSLAQWWRLRKFERDFCLASDHILAVSEADARALGRLSPSIPARTTLLPNGVDPTYWSREDSFSREEVPTSGNPTLVFDGTMDFRPNVDAVLWFAGNVWPLIKTERPGARFFIVGRNPSPQVLSLSETPGITVTGTVDDPRPWVASADVYVVPMRMGGGVRLKVLQAMSMGCAVVSTPMGADGIDVQHNKHLLLANSASDFAQATLTLLDDPAHCAALGTAARTLVSTRYAWDALLPTLDHLYK